MPVDTTIANTPGIADQPVSQMVPNPEPPERSVIRDMLTQKAIQLEADPFGGNTMNANPSMNAPATANYPGLGAPSDNTAQLTGLGQNFAKPGAQGGFNGSQFSNILSQLMGGGRGGFYSAMGNAAPQQNAIPQLQQLFQRMFGQQQGASMDGIRTLFRRPSYAGSATYTGGAPQESPQQVSGPQMGGAAQRTAAPTPGLQAAPLQGQQQNPMLANLAMMNQENAGNGPNKAWNSNAPNNPWKGMNQQQFQQSMMDNVGGSGVSGLEKLAGPNWQSAAPVNIPGLTYTGANHELGGNPYIGAAGARAGLTPQQMALWTLQGYQSTQNNPIQGQWNQGPNGMTWQQNSGYNLTPGQSNPQGPPNQGPPMQAIPQPGQVPPSWLQQFPQFFQQFGQGNQ